LLCFSGCFTLTSDEIRQLQRRILDTHRRVAKLEESTAQSFDELREETRRARADMDESLKSAVEEAERTRGQVDDNTYYIRELTGKLDTILYSLQAAREGAGPKSAAVPAETEKASDEASAAKVAEAQQPESAPTLLKAVSPVDDYARAKQDYDRGHFELAKLEFEEYLRLYPDSERAPNAQFWLAECYFKSGDLQRAVQEFKKVYMEFPKNVKMADAMLNEGYAHLKLGDNGEAIKLFRRVISEYPVSPAAQSAKIKLGTLGESAEDTPE